MRLLLSTSALEKWFGVLDHSLIKKSEYVIDLEVTSIGLNLSAYKDEFDLLMKNYVGR